MNPRNYKPLHIFLFLLGLGLFIYAANTGCLLDSPDEAYAPPKGFGLKGGPNVTVVTKSVFRIFTQGASYDGCERVLFLLRIRTRKSFRQARSTTRFAS